LDQRVHRQENAVDPGAGDIRTFRPFDYDGYNAVVALNALMHVGCMAHARRMFSEAMKAQGKKKG